MKLPKTINGMNALECVSAMQKCIRRGLEREAMEFATELLHTSKAFCSMACNRLEVTLHEDVDVLGQPHLAPMVKATLDMARAHWKKDKPHEARLMVGTVVRALCRAEKSREGCHFSAAIGLRSIQDEYTPEIPDFAYDVHTHKGRRLGRGLDHFLKEGAKLAVAKKPDRDPYEEEAVARWRKKYNKGKAA